MNPRVYKEGDKVIISVKNLSSRRAVTSLDYFSFPLCSADNINGDKSPNIFKILSGDNLHNTSIETTFLKDKQCAFYCKIYIDDDVYNKYKHLILYNYNMIYSVDNLEIFREDPRRKGYYYTGIPIGYIKDKSYHLYTHYKITILYNIDGNPDKNYIVGFEVDSRSVDFSINEDCVNNENNMVMDMDKYVTFKYDIKYVKSNKSVRHRSEHYYRNLNDQNINKYNRINTNIFETDDMDDRGWKLVHGDVFRKPRNSTFFSAFVGVGNKKNPIELPVRVNNIPRHIPKQPYLNSFFASSFLVGLILFATMYTELFFLFTSLWKSNMYYLFGTFNNKKWKGCL
ncbi:endomembrane protein 70, putative, partial [Plasmodium malariae]